MMLKIKSTHVILLVLVISLLFISKIAYEALQNATLHETIKKAQLKHYEVISSIGKQDNTVTDDSQAAVEKDGKCPYHNCIMMAVVCCLGRINETTALMKSAIALTSPSYRIVYKVFADEKAMGHILAFNSSWPAEIQKRVTIEVYSATYPPGVIDEEWRYLFRPCGTIRLFFPDVLKDTDALLYTDTDFLFMAPTEVIWAHFGKMNSSQMISIVQENENESGWYNNDARHPYYGKFGLNSGLMLMNLTRLRKFSWNEYLVPVLKEYREVLKWGDQDIINIIFHYHPDKVYIHGCEYNYRLDHCHFFYTCDTLEEHGLVAIHGSRWAFHLKEQFASFAAIYETWSEYELGTDLRTNLYEPMRQKLSKDKDTKCGRLFEQYLMNIKKVIDSQAPQHSRELGH